MDISTVPTSEALTPPTIASLPVPAEDAYAEPGLPPLPPNITMPDPAEMLETVAKHNLKDPALVTPLPETGPLGDTTGDLLSIASDFDSLRTQISNVVSNLSEVKGEIMGINQLMSKLSLEVTQLATAVQRLNHAADRQANLEKTLEALEYQSKNINIALQREGVDLEHILQKDEEMLVAGGVVVEATTSPTMDPGKGKQKSSIVTLDREL
jgi:hypothetical protein